MSTRTQRAIAALAWLAPGATAIASFLLGIWLRSSQWGLTGLLMCGITLAGVGYRDAVTRRVELVESTEDRIRRELIRERDEAIAQFEREIGIS